VVSTLRRARSAGPLTADHVAIVDRGPRRRPESRTTVALSLRPRRGLDLAARVAASQRGPWRASR